MPPGRAFRIDKDRVLLWDDFWAWCFGGSVGEGVGVGVLGRKIPWDLLNLVYKVGKFV